MTTETPAPVEIRPAAGRPHTEIDWLDSWHSFSFGRHYDPANTDHGLLLVSNDDRVAAGGGFGTHPHRDMEIVTWVLAGELEHRDTAGNRGLLYPGLAQRMSAGHRHPPLGDEPERGRAECPLRADVGAARHRRHRPRLRAAATSTTSSTGGGLRRRSRRARARRARSASTSATPCCGAAGSAPGEQVAGARRAARARVRRRRRGRRSTAAARSPRATPPGSPAPASPA